MEGPSKAEVDFNDRKDGSCHVSYVVEEPGEYSVGIRFNEIHIPGSPYKVMKIRNAGFFCRHSKKLEANLEKNHQLIFFLPKLT